MSKNKTEKKSPPTAREAAELRRLLHEKLGPIETDARTVLATITKLRHSGDLDQLSQLSAVSELAKGISKNLKRVGEAVVEDDSPAQ